MNSKYSNKGAKKRQNIFGKCITFPNLFIPFGCNALHKLSSYNIQT